MLGVSGHRFVAMASADCGVRPGRSDNWDCASAEISLHGAHVLSWKPAPARECLYLSPNASQAPGAAIRGGIPVIFPQFAGLGVSSTSRQYSIKSVAEAEAYLRHPVLGPRLLESVTAVLGVEGRSAFDVFGSPDDRKLQSCATLFASVSPAGSVFEQLLDRYFGGERDDKTLRLIEPGYQR